MKWLYCLPPYDMYLCTDVTLRLLMGMHATILVFTSYPTFDKKKYTNQYYILIKIYIMKASLFQAWF